MRETTEAPNAVSDNVNALVSLADIKKITDEIKFTKIHLSQHLSLWIEEHGRFCIEENSTNDGWAVRSEQFGQLIANPKTFAMARLVVAILLYG